MSGPSPGPGWWLASDGRWYPPEQVPATPPVAPPGAPPVGPAWSGAPLGAGAGYPAPVPTNGLAVASLVCSLLFWIVGLGAVLGIVFGFIARSQIKRSAGGQKGEGLALAGIIIGVTALVIGVALVIGLAILVHHCDQTGSCTITTTPNGG